jgi:hypothetical protein
MRQELKYVLYLVGLGASLIAYAHSTFATKDSIKTIAERVKTIDDRVYDIHRYYKLNKENK